MVFLFVRGGSLSDEQSANQINEARKRQAIVKVTPSRRLWMPLLPGGRDETRLKQSSPDTVKVSQEESVKFVAGPRQPQGIGDWATTWSMHILTACFPVFRLQQCSENRWTLCYIHPVVITRIADSSIEIKGTWNVWMSETTTELYVMGKHKWHLLCTAAKTDWTRKSYRGTGRLFGSDSDCCCKLMFERSGYRALFVYVLIPGFTFGMGSCFTGLRGRFGYLSFANRSQERFHITSTPTPQKCDPLGQKWSCVRSFRLRKLSGLRMNTTPWSFVPCKAGIPTPGTLGAGGTRKVFMLGASTIEPEKQLVDGFTSANIIIDKGSVNSRKIWWWLEYWRGVNYGELCNHRTFILLPMPCTATTNDAGRIWLIIGTDSGYEGITTLYYTHRLMCI